MRYFALALSYFARAKFLVRDFQAGFGRCLVFGNRQDLKAERALSTPKQVNAEGKVLGVRWPDTAFMWLRPASWGGVFCLSVFVLYWR